MKLSLEVLTAGKWLGKTIPVTLSQFLIGRDPQCQLRPASPVISKRHCAVLVRNGKVFVRDFDSTNGTFVNDQPIKGEVELKNDDRLKVGPLDFRVRLDATTPVNKPTPAPPTKTPVPAAAPKPAAKPAESVDDDSVADMLMAILDDGAAPPSSPSDPMVPEGSTIMEGLDAPPGADKAKAEKDKAKQATGDTSNAAKAILEKYMRRPRT